MILDHGTAAKVEKEDTKVEKEGEISPGVLQNKDLVIQDSLIGALQNKDKLLVEDKTEAVHGRDQGREKEENTGEITENSKLRAILRGPVLCKYYSTFSTFQIHPG